MPTILRTGRATLRIDDHGGAVHGRPALVFLHYWGGSAATWRKVVACLSGEARCVAVNQRGWGGSTVADGRYDLHSMADDVLAVIARLGLGRVVLVGHSMGGKVAQIVAQAKPAEVGGLVLVAPAPPTPMPIPEEARRAMLQSYQSAAGVEQALRVLAGPSLTAGERQGVVADTLAGEPGAKRAWTEQGMASDLGIAPGDVQVPLTLLVGSLDQVEQPERLRAVFGAVTPQARFVEVPGVGHLLPLEAPEAVASACRDMLAAVADRRSAVPSPLA